jgi:hypothetical protein
MPLSPISGERPLSYQPAEVSTDPGKAKKSAPSGIAEHKEGIIYKTSSELAKADYSVNQKSEPVIEREKAAAKASKLLVDMVGLYDQNEFEENLLSYYKTAAKPMHEAASPELKEMIDDVNEIIKVGENTADYDDDFNFEKTMVSFHKMLLASVRDDAETQNSMVKQFEDELKKIGEKRNKEFQKIIDRMGRRKWFDALEIGGTAVGGFAGVVALTVASAGTATIVGAVAGTVILTGMAADKALGNPFENALKKAAPNFFIDSAKVAAIIGGTLLYALNDLMIIPMATKLLSEGGMAITRIQDSHSEAKIEKGRNETKLRSEVIDDLRAYLEFLSNLIKERHRNMREIARNPKIFN